MKFKFIYFILFFIVSNSTITYGRQIDQPYSKKEALYSFAKLYGYVKYFHPSDEAQEIDWDKFALYGAKEVRKAQTTEQLKSTLLRVFKPIAPALEIYRASEKKEISVNQIIGIEPATETVYWQHIGNGESGFNSVYNSVRVNRKTPKNFINKSYKFTLPLSEKFSEMDSFRINFIAKHENLDWPGYTSVRMDSYKNGVRNNRTDLVEFSSEVWNKINTDEEIKYDTDSASIIFNFHGRGSLLIDRIEVFQKCQECSSWEVLLQENFKCSELYKEHDSYIESRISMKQGKCALKIQSADIENEPQKLYEFDVPIGHSVHNSIGNGLYCLLPIALPSVRGKTLPQADSLLLIDLKREIFESTKHGWHESDSLDSRVMNTIVSWNAIRHFYPYSSITRPDWDKNLKNLISLSLNSEVSQTDLLKILINSLRDGHGSVSKGNTYNQFYFPFLVEALNEKAVITKIYDDKLAYLKGSEITHVDNLPINEDIARKEGLYSASKRASLLKKIFFNYSNSQFDRPRSFQLKTVKDSTIQVELNPTMNAYNFYKNFFRLTDYKSVDHIDESIMYVDMSRFDVVDFEKNLGELSKAQSIIIDGRLIVSEEAYLIVDYFIEKKDSINWMFKPQISFPDFPEDLSYEASGWYSQPKKNIKPKSLFYMTSNFARSYGESMAAYFEAMPNCTIVGQSTAGTNGNMNYVYLPGNYTLIYTGMKVLKHDGSQLHGVGITPDVYVERTQKGIAEGRDEVLEKAIELAKAELEKEEE